jgi:hypothetical protein
VQPTEGFLDLPCACFIVPLPPTSKLQNDHGAKVVCIEITSVLLYFYFHGTTAQEHETRDPEDDTAASSNFVLNLLYSRIGMVEVRAVISLEKTLWRL